MGRKNLKRCSSAPQYLIDEDGQLYFNTRGTTIVSYRKVIEKLENLIEDSIYSVESLANTVGYSKDHLVKVLRYQNTISLTALNAILDELGYEIEFKPKTNTGVF